MDSPLTVSLTEFDLQPAGCNTGISYDLTWEGGQPAPGDLLTLNTLPLSITVENSNPLFPYTGTYTVRLTGTFGAQTAFLEF